ncbi:transposase [Candidatus Vondammii sp. HM_W22]|uniref:transposase n=1 Tax=Candidatus Vondammii sp. HM_W22 TaxID=2687299 RepID=UPI002E7B5029|nr:transposase [Candidatus Vondammii sp. HM_W22]
MFNLSDDQTKLQIRARYSFCHFLGLSSEGKIPDAKIVWVYRERLKEPGLADKLFSELLIQIDAAGFSVRKGQIVDAAIVPVPRQHNTREENRQIKAGDSTEIWSDNKRRQKNVEAHWNHEAWQNPLWVQKPHQHRPEAQGHSQVRHHIS